MKHMKALGHHEETRSFVVVVVIVSLAFKEPSHLPTLRPELLIISIKKKNAAPKA